MSDELQRALETHARAGELLDRAQKINADAQRLLRQARWLARIAFVFACVAIAVTVIP